jgi:Fic family protein
LNESGNRRVLIGRLLITALMEHWGLLAQPLMVLSGYLKQHQAEYDRRLSAVKLLEDLDILVELTGQKKNRVYSYQAYVELLSR